MISEIQAGRSQLLAPVRYEEFDLSVARDRQILGITANTFYVDPGADNSAYRGATATLWIDDSPLTVGAGFLLRKQTSNVRLSNAAQASKRLRLVYGQDLAITSWFTSSGISLNTPNTLIPETGNFFTSVSAGNIAQLSAGSTLKLWVLSAQLTARHWIRHDLATSWNQYNWSPVNGGPGQLTSGSYGPYLSITQSPSVWPLIRSRCTTSMFMDDGDPTLSPLQKQVVTCFDYFGELSFQQLFASHPIYIRSLNFQVGGLYSSYSPPAQCDVQYNFV